MAKTSLVLLWFIGSLSVCSVIYFLGLLIHLPAIFSFIISGIISVAGALGLQRDIKDDSLINDKYFLKEIVLAIALAVLAFKCLQEAEKYGNWDAWSIWNLHARFLTSADHWQAMVQPLMARSHPDYPLMLPGINACGLRFSDHVLLVPFAVGLLFTYSVVGLTFSALANKNVIVGIASLAAFVFSDYYPSQGAAQYADIPLAFYYLATLVCLHHYELNSKAIYLAMATFFTACAVCTKNEGVLFALFVLLFYTRDIFRKKNIAGVIIAAFLPGLAWILFKLFYAPANDLMSQQGVPYWQRITNIESSRIILDALWTNLKLHYPELLVAAVVSLICAVINRKILNKKMMLLLCTLLACQATYLVTPYSLEWHLGTSQDRLVLQVFPAIIFVSGISLANVLQRFKWMKI